MQSLEKEISSDHNEDLPGTGKGVGLIGAPLNFGADMAGVDLGPAVLRVAGVVESISQLGYEVHDYGDISVEHRVKRADPNDKAKYLNEISKACLLLAEQVREILTAGELPIVLGGDHSIAIGSISGVSSFFRERGKSLGLIWFDAHADMNTPETSLSGHVHGMPLAAMLGFGPSEITNILGTEPQIKPQFCAHLGARDIDFNEKPLVRDSGIRVFTMREIDERGMAACVDEAIAIASKASAGYHVTFDVDVLDPVVAPGSGTLVRGGLSYREAHLGLEKIADDSKLVSLEIVEINTALDVNNRTAQLGVELILSALGKRIL